jgi:hypothetical protein
MGVSKHGVGFVSKVTGRIDTEVMLMTLRVTGSNLGGGTRCLDIVILFSSCG